MEGKELNIPRYTVVYGDIMESTTIKIHIGTKGKLDTFRENKNESYDEVISKLVYIAKNLKKDPGLSAKTVMAIDDARTRYKEGRYISEKEMKKRLGL